MTTPHSTTPLNTDTPSQAPLATAMKMDRYKKYFFGLGIAELIFGVACLIFSFVRIALGLSSIAGILLFYIPNSGIIVATGIIGIITKCRSSPCLYTTNLVMSGISAIAAGNLFFNHAFSLGYGSWTPALIAELVLALIAFLLCLLHSIFSCIGSCIPCCGQSSYQGQVLHPLYEQRYVHLGNGQYNLVQEQSVATETPTVPSNLLQVGNPTLYPQPEQPTPGGA